MGAGAPAQAEAQSRASGPVNVSPEPSRLSVYKSREGRAHTSRSETLGAKHNPASGGGTGARAVGASRGVWVQGRPHTSLQC